MPGAIAFLGAAEGFFTPVPCGNRGRVGPFTGIPDSGAEHQ